MRVICVIGSLVLALPTMSVALTAAGAKGRLFDASQLMRQGDHLAGQGQERMAAERYRAAHVLLQQLLYDTYLEELRGALGAPSASDESIREIAGEAADLRNVNLSKLWIVLDPDDRAFDHKLEGERAELLAQFAEITSRQSAVVLDDFLRRLYPDDPAGERQMDAVRAGSLPSSRRWDRLQKESEH